MQKLLFIIMSYNIVTAPRDLMVLHSLILNVIIHNVINIIYQRQAHLFNFTSSLIICQYSVNIFKQI